MQTYSEIVEPVFYNDNDSGVCMWLRELIKAGQLPEGTIDERSITDLRAVDLSEYRQVHLFAGIGGWVYALQLAGWNPARPVWTGSCPCQPFSAAGKQEGEKDKRHLWPEMRRLIAECRPATVFGEQVASRLGREWLAGVFADLESLGYAVAGADLPAAGVAAPHKRQRLFWVAHTPGSRWGQVDLDAQRSRGGGSPETPCPGWEEGDRRFTGGSGGSGHPVCNYCARFFARFRCNSPDECDCPRCQGMCECADDVGQQPEQSGFWDAFEPVSCRDGKSRRSQSGVHPLADGLPGRVGLLRGYGNSIVPQVAAIFIKAFLEAETMSEREK